MTKRVLITGAGGFIGAHALEHLLHETDWHVTATDSFRHKGKTDRIRQVLEGGPPEWRGRVTVVMIGVLRCDGSPTNRTHRRGRSYQLPWRIILILNSWLNAPENVASALMAKPERSQPITSLCSTM